MSKESLINVWNGSSYSLSDEGFKELMATLPLVERENATTELLEVSGDTLEVVGDEDTKWLEEQINK